jgi:radical SAM protein with 4Fe4S-binding SPASM domain
MTALMRPAGHPGSHPGGHPGGHPAGIGAVGSVRPEGYVFNRAPMLVYWETTTSCGLACRHCRAEAIPERAPDELTTDEGFRLLDAITGFGQPYPHVVFTGGDPLRRSDLESLVEAATARGIGASLAPAATPELTPERLRTLKAAGIQTMSLSLDGSTPERHDGFRGVPGTFEATLRAAEWTHDIGLPLQVNTLITDETLEDLPAIYDLMTRIGIIRWSLFFLISVGRGFGVRDGNGILFVASNGYVFPSGFLPLPVGNVRTDDLVALYREHPVFTGLRDSSQFKGRCGRCEYAQICGGSRARAFAWTGDPLEADPLCPFVPPVPALATAGVAS